MRNKLLVCVLGAGLAGAIVAGQSAIGAGQNWTYFHGDQAATKYSTLTQINASNVSRLKRAWTFHTGDSSGFFESTPMVIDSVMYFSAQNGVYSLDALTGKQLWKYEMTGAARRGPSYWPGANGVGPRIFSTTAQGFVALDARTGTVIKTFGSDGFIPNLRPSSPAAIYRNLVITQGGQARPNEGDTGVGNTVKAWDAVTGKNVWTFYMRAQKDDPNSATWLGESANSTASPGLWGVFSIDVQRGLLFVPVEKVGNNYWGGSNHGNNLYSDSLVALDVNTGKMKWFQQLVHHDIWDYDLAAAPTLIETRRNGQTIPGVALMTKMGLMFVFNRVTGEPMWGMEERPVPQTTAPGEWTSPTQPFPIKPAPLARMSLKKEELAKVTPELEAFCANLWSKYKLQDAVPYDPWRVGQDIVVFPGAIGGGNWQGSTYNAALGLIITNVHNNAQWGHLQAPNAGGGGGRGGRGAAADADDDAAPAAGGRGGAGRGGARGGGAPAETPAAQPAPQAELPANVVAPGTPVPGALASSKSTPEGGRFWDPQHRYSCAQPPWGELIAVDANTGDIRWRVPAGEFPELTAKGVPPTGQPMLGGAMTTAGGLVFMGATVDGVFRAFDARNGKILWSEKLAAPAHSIASSFMGRDGKQYIVVPAGGGSYLRSETSDEVIAWTLP